jgi:hypothetical protein
MADIPPPNEGRTFKERRGFVKTVGATLAVITGKSLLRAIPETVQAQPIQEQKTNLLLEESAPRIETQSKNDPISEGQWQFGDKGINMPAVTPDMFKFPRQLKLAVFRGGPPPSALQNELPPSIVHKPRPSDMPDTLGNTSASIQAVAARNANGIGGTGILGLMDENKLSIDAYDISNSSFLADVAISDALTKLDQGEKLDVAVIPSFNAHDSNLEQGILELKSRGVYVICAGSDTSPSENVGSSADITVGSFGIYSTDGITNETTIKKKGDILAPGHNVPFLHIDGTSTATYEDSTIAGTQVAAVVLLIKSVNPDITNDRITQILKSSTSPLDGTTELKFDASKAITQAQQSIGQQPSPPSHPGTPAQTKQIFVPLVNNS